MNTTNKTIQITIGGHPVSGKSTAGEKIAQALNIEYYDMGRIMREIADRKKMSLGDLMELRKNKVKNEKDETINDEVDAFQKELAQSSKSFVLVSRLGFHFVPSSLKFLITVSIDIAAQRFLKDSAQRNEGDQADIDKIKECLEKRKNDDQALFKSLYGIYDIYNQKNYNYCINSDNLTPAETVDHILKDISWEYS